ncbi:MAG: ComEC family competence protein [Candidatus Azobacteroides sp.]|nr:ComEC family competence protein [Candidatus Azobacteroides sp.]
MIKTLRQAVFLRLTLFFAFGIVVQTQKNLFPYWIYCLAFSFLILFLAFFPKIASSYRLRWLFGVGLFLLCASSAGILTHTNRKQSEWSEEEGIRSYRVQLIAEPVRKPRTWMCKVKTGDKTVLIYLPIDSASSSLSPSDWLAIEARFEKAEPINLRRQGIAARAFVSENRWGKIETPPGQHFNLRFYSLKCRRIVLNRLKKILPDEKSFAVAAAISFGYVDELDKDIRQVFAATGSSHILSISGLHFAIIYGALYFLFSFLGNNRRGRMIRQLIILPLLWIFAFFVGLAPSVMRAVIMITLWGIGNAFFFRALTINTVGAAAFFMLLYNPFYLFDVGFQLSFSAVLAILLINPHLISLYHSRNPMINYIWELSCTSTSAQLGTAPLSLYYFHQFPLLYLISNIFAIPFTGILLLLIPLSLLVSFFCGNQPELLFPLQKLLSVFINVLGALAEIPHGVVSDIQLTVKDALNLTLGIVFSFLFIIKKRMIYLCLLFILVVLQVLYYLCPL